MKFAQVINVGVFTRLNQNTMCVPFSISSIAILYFTCTYTNSFHSYIQTTSPVNDKVSLMMTDFNVNRQCEIHITISGHFEYLLNEFFYVLRSLVFPRVMQISYKISSSSLLSFLMSCVHSKNFGLLDTLSEVCIRMTHIYFEGL